MQREKRDDDVIKRGIITSIYIYFCDASLNSIRKSFRKYLQKRRVEAVNHGKIMTRHLISPKSAPACSSTPQSSPEVESKRPVDIKLTIRWVICSICVLKYTEAFLFSFLLKYDF